MQSVRVACFDMGTRNFAGVLVTITGMPPDFDTDLVRVYDNHNGGKVAPPKNVVFDWLKVESAFALDLKDCTYNLFKADNVINIEKEYLAKYSGAKLETINTDPIEEDEVIDCTTSKDPLEKKKPAKLVPRVPFLRSIIEKTENQTVVDNLTRIFHQDDFLFLSLMDYYIAIENQMDQIDELAPHQRNSEKGFTGLVMSNPIAERQKRKKKAIMWALSLVLRSTFNPIHSRMKSHVVCFTHTKYGLRPCLRRYVPEYYSLSKDTKYRLRKQWSKKVGFALCWASRQSERLMNTLYCVDKPDILDALNMAIAWVVENFKKPTKKQIATGIYIDDELDVDEVVPENNTSDQPAAKKRKRENPLLSTSRDTSTIEAVQDPKGVSVKKKSEPKETSDEIQEPPLKKQKVTPPTPEKVPPKKTQKQQEIDPVQEGEKVYSRLKKQPSNEFGEPKKETAPTKQPSPLKKQATLPTKPVAKKPLAASAKKPLSLPRTQRPSQRDEYGDFEDSVDEEPFGDILAGFSKDNNNKFNNHNRKHAPSDKSSGGKFKESNSGFGKTSMFTNFDDIMAAVNSDYN